MAEENKENTPKDRYGRPTVVTPEVVQKLEQAFALGCTDLEACFYAGISRGTLHNYQTANPDFLDRKEELKMKPVLLARQTVMKGIAGYEIKDDQGKVIKVVNSPDPKLAMDFLKNKMHKEFKQGHDVSGNVRFDKNKRQAMLAKWFKQPSSSPAPAQPEAPEPSQSNAGAENAQVPE